MMSPGGLSDTEHMVFGESEMVQTSTSWGRLHVMRTSVLAPDVANRECGRGLCTTTDNHDD
jgi:hypothetical protein